MAEKSAMEYYPVMEGPGREEALERFRAQLDEWGIPEPKVEPIVIHFCLDDFDKYGLIEYWIANEAEEGYCGKFLFVFDGQTCPYHHHDYKHETFYIVKGKTKMNVDGEERVMDEGEVLAMPPGVKHSFTGIGPVLLLEASKPCREHDNIFQNKQVGKDGVV